MTKSIPRKQSDICVARHEAAHAVLAEALGNRVTVVKLTRAGHGYSEAIRRRIDPMREAIVALAGHAAAMRWHRWPRTLMPLEDARTVRRLGFGGRSVSTLLDITLHLVAEAAAAIDAVARELKRHRKLTGREVRRIMKAHGLERGAMY